MEQFNNFNQEFSPNGTEYFEIKKESKKKKKENKTSSVAKILAASTALTVSIVGVSNSLNSSTSPPIILVQPEFVETSIINYVEPLETELGSYEILFDFILNDGIIDNVEVKSVIYNYGDVESGSEILNDEFIIENEDLTIEDGHLIIPYLVDNVFNKYEIDVILNYELGKETLSLTNSLVADCSYLYFNEVEVNPNSISSSLVGEEIKFKTNIDTYNQGLFDYYIESVEIYYNDEPYENLEIPLPMILEDFLAYEFVFPKEDLNSAKFEIYIEGDSYLDGKKMNLSSSTIVMDEFIYGTSYSISEMDVSNLNIEVDTFTLARIEFESLPGKGYTSKIDQVVAGREVRVRLVLEGVATRDFILASEIGINDEKILEYDLSYTNDIYVYQNDTEIYIEFYFIMPEANVVEGDINIYGIFINE